MPRPETPPADPAAADDPAGPRWLGVARTLKFRLAVAGMLALAVAIGATTAVLVLRVERDTLAANEQAELAEAVRIARQLSRRLAAQQRLLAVAAASIDDQMVANPAALLQALRVQSVLLEQFDSISIADATGRLRLLHDDKGFRDPDTAVGDRPYFRQAMAEGRPVISEAFTSRVRPERVVVLAQPLMATGSAVGVLAAGIRLQRHDLLASLADEEEGDRRRFMAVTDGAGTLLAHTDAAFVGKPMAEVAQLVPMQQRWQAMGAPAEPAGVLLYDASHVAAAAGVAGTGWMVWRAHERADVLAPLRAARREAAAWATALVAVMGLALLATLWWLLRPLAQLQRRAEHLFDGELAADQGWPQAGGEIGRLEQVLRRAATERALLETQNAQKQRQLESVLAAAPSGIALTRAQRFELVSPQFCALFKRPEQSFLGQPASAIFASAQEYADLGPKVGAAFAQGQPFVAEIEMLRADGERFWSRLRGSPVTPGDPTAGTTWTVTDASDEVQSRAELQRAAEHDALTGLANRKAFEVLLARALALHQADGRAALLLADLDRFKPINDSYGHAAGDAMLRAVAEALRSGVRAHDTAFRLGGDEFAVLLRDCPEDAALRVAETLRAAVAALRLPWAGQEQALDVGMSVGVAMCSSSSHATAMEWIAAADAACYAAKAAGRNVVRLAA